MENGIIGIVGVAATGALSHAAIRDEVSAWATLICTIAIALTTCAVQVWQIWKKRDKMDAPKPSESPDTKTKESGDKGNK